MPLHTYSRICRPNMGLQSLPKPKTSRSQADSLSLCVRGFSHLDINVVHTKLLAFARVCFCNTSDYICRPTMGLESLPKTKTFSSQANSSTLCASDFSHLDINVVHTRFLAFGRVFFLVILLSSMSLDTYLCIAGRTCDSSDVQN